MQNLDLTKKYVLAVSGGIDSMVMLAMFAALKPRPDFSVVTVNHGIRKEAQSDCDFVADYCKKIDVDCSVFCVDAPKYSEENKISLETAARVLRYKVLAKSDCDFVCLAHHADDNAETVLMHILRGSGAYGAQGIKRINGKYLRPLIDLTREEIEIYALKNNVPFVVDSTNAETIYTRNLVRREVMPMLKKINSCADKNLVRFANNIAEDNAYLDTLADISEVDVNANGARIPKRLFLQPRPVAYRVFRKVFERIGVFKDIEKTHFETIVRLASGQGGKKAFLPFGFVAVNDYDFISIERQSIGESLDFEIPFALGNVQTPFGTVSVSKDKTPQCLRIDLNAVPPDAVFRVKRQGDVFCKFAGGQKTLKKYLIDKKIPQRKRNKLILLASGSEILVICGVEISDKVKTDVNSDIYFISVQGE